MTTRWIETLVGIFLVLGMLAFVFLALSASGLAFNAARGSYTVNAFFANVGGLTSRAEVSLAGVGIGSVESITLDREERTALVKMKINGDIDYLPLDTSASILTAGLLGEKYIALQLGADEEHLANGDYILDTQSTVVLEELIGQFLVGSGKD